MMRGLRLLLLSFCILAVVVYGRSIEKRSIYVLLSVHHCLLIVQPAMHLQHKKLLVLEVWFLEIKHY
jgi:hypothetical protein